MGSVAVFAILPYWKGSPKFLNLAMDNSLKFTELGARKTTT